MDAMKSLWYVFAVVFALGVSGLRTTTQITVRQPYLTSPDSHRRDVAYMPTDTSFNQPYGVYVDMRYLTNDPDRVCRLAGDRVRFNFGGAADPLECNIAYPNGNWTQSTLEPNCTITCEQADVIDVPRTQFFNELVAEVRIKCRTPLSYMILNLLCYSDVYLDCAEDRNSAHRPSGSYNRQYFPDMWLLRRQFACTEL